MFPVSQSVPSANPIAYRRLRPAFAFVAASMRRPPPERRRNRQRRLIVGREAVAIADRGGSLKDGEKLREIIREVTEASDWYWFSRTCTRTTFSARVPSHRISPFLSVITAFRTHSHNEAELLPQSSWTRSWDKVQPVQVVEPTMLSERALKSILAVEFYRSLPTPLRIRTAISVSSTVKPPTFLPSDLLFVRRVPSLDEAVSPGWLRELDALQKLDAPGVAVPGHGPPLVSSPAGASHGHRALSAGPARRPRQAVAKGLEIGEAVQAVGQSERGRWTLFDEYHGHNVTKAYKELEWE